MTPVVVAGCPYTADRDLTGWREAISAQTVQPAAVVTYLDAGGTSTREGRSRDGHAHLATVRNRWIDVALRERPDATHLWSVDSDIQPDPDCLALLLAADKPIIAAVVRNSTASVWNFMLGRDDEGPVRRGDEALWPLVWGRVDGLPFRVPMTGACVLIRRDVLDAGVRYGVHSRGEDAAFSVAADEAGFASYVHPLARTRHFMREEEEPLR